MHAYEISFVKFLLNKSGLADLAEILASAVDPDEIPYVNPCTTFPPPCVDTIARQNMAAMEKEMESHYP